MNELLNDFKDSSASRVLLIIILGVVWSLLLRLDLPDFKLPHIFMVFTMFLIALIFGEAVRWLLSAPRVGPPPERSDIKLSEEEKQEEYLALNYGILIGVALIVLTLLHMLF